MEEVGRGFLRRRQKAQMPERLCLCVWPLCGRLCEKSRRARLRNHDSGLPVAPASLCVIILFLPVRVPEPQELQGQQVPQEQGPGLLQRGQQVPQERASAN